MSTCRSHHVSELGAAVEVSRLALSDSSARPRGYLHQCGYPWLWCGTRCHTCEPGGRRRWRGLHGPDVLSELRHAGVPTSRTTSRPQA